jgi:uncharacterized protein involved in exopolysaccharide biosynthesis
MMAVQEDDEISLKEVFFKLKNWFKYLLEHKKLIVVLALAGAIAGIFYALSKKPEYTASLSFVLEDDKAKTGGALGLASQFGFDLGAGSSGAFSGDNLIELMKSRTLTNKTLLNTVRINNKSIYLAEMYLEFNQWRKSWEGNPALANFKFNPALTSNTLVQDSLLGLIFEKLTTENLSVTQKDKKTSIIYIEVKSKSELFSKYYTEALSREVCNFYIETKSKKAKINLAVLSKQTDSVRAELNAAIAGVATANDKTFNLNPALNINRVPSARRQVDVQANTAILNELVKNMEMARVTLRKETPLIQVIDTPILPLKKEKVSKLKSIITGGFIGALLAILFLSFKRFKQKISRLNK